MIQCDGILFDLDGTLWDSSREVADSWRGVIEKRPELAVPTYEQLGAVMGMSDTELMRTLYPQLTEEEGLKLFEDCCEEENAYLQKHGARSYPGVKTLLQKLSQKHKLAIVSNCNKGYIECYMESMGTLGYISDHECFGNTRRPKGENIRLVMERCGFRNPIYVGDTKWDMEAAALAGIPFVHAAYGFGDLPGVLPKINTPLELLTLLGED